MRSRYLFFTNECVGLGHLRRTVALARAVTARDPSASALVVTGSPAVSSFPAVPGVDTAKLPQLGRRADGRLDAPALEIDAVDVQSMRSRLAVTYAEAFSPDVVVVDKTPSGIDGELLAMLDRVRERGRARIVLGLRDVEDDPDVVRRTWQERRLVRTVERYYDAVLVYGPPGSPDALTTLQARPPRVPVHHVGYVTTPLPAHPPADLPDDYLLVTLGGGVDGAPTARAVLAALRLRPLPLCTLLVTGPLMPGPQVEELRRAAEGLDVRIARFRPDVDAAVVGARAVVAMAGYNTVSEVLRAGRPCLLVPRVRPSAEQLVRARMLRDRGVAEMLLPDELDPATVRTVLDRLLAHPRAGVRPAAAHDGAERAARLLTDKGRVRVAGAR